MRVLFSRVLATASSSLDFELTAVFLSVCVFLSFLSLVSCICSVDATIIYLFVQRSRRSWTQHTPVFFPIMDIFTHVMVRTIAHRNEWYRQLNVMHHRDNEITGSITSAYI